MNIGTKAVSVVRQEYENAVDPGLVEFIEYIHSVDKTDADKFEYKVSSVNQRQKADIERLTGKPLHATSIFIKGGTIRHIESRHGTNGKADHSMADIDDVARIGYVLENYDSIDFLRNEKGDLVRNTGYLTKNGTPAPMLMYTKRINGFYCVAVVIGDGKRGRLNIISAYKSRKKP